jgi:hypothetical protein
LALYLFFSYREEALPLFGSGNPSLHDPVEEVKSSHSSVFHPAGIAAIFKKNKTDGYGSIAQKESDDDEEDEDDDDDDDLSPSGQTPSIGSTFGTSSKPHIPRQNPCLWLFHFIQFMACVSSLCLVATQIIPIILLPADQIMTRMNALSLALKVYISVFCLMFIIVEADLPVPWIQQSPLLVRFFSRGFVYSFIGLVCVEESYSERVRDILHLKDEFHVGWAAIFMQISSWLMLAIGCIYMIMGIFCLKGLRDRLKQKEAKEWKHYRKEMKEWRDLHE